MKYEEPRMTIKEFQKYKIITLESGDGVLDVEKFPDLSEVGGNTEG